jgi:5-methylcytosine-specific restriction endonuclease McrA
MRAACRWPKSELELVEAAIGYVFREQGLKELGEILGVGWLSVRRALVQLGIPIRTTHEQRICDRRRGRHDQAEAIKRAWLRGAYASEVITTEGAAMFKYERSGEKNPFHGKRHSESTRNHLAKCAAKRVVPGRGAYGPSWTACLRSRIVERDSHRCQVCNASGPKLQVHHVDLDRTNNDDKNLMTLCSACHLAYHGRGDLVDEVATAHRFLLTRLGVGVERQC